MKVFFDHSEQEAANITTFYFRPEQKLVFTAGQYIELTLRHDNTDNYGDKRKFSLSSSPSDKLLSITSKFTDQDGSSFKAALPKLKPGDELEISGPKGDFVLPELIQTPLVFVAGGIGVTPFHSILSWLETSKETRPIKLLYGVNTEDEIVFESLLKRMTRHMTTVVNNPSDAWGGETGYINAELILGLEKPTDDTLIYISGPEVMVDILCDDLVEKGVNKQQIMLDEFRGYTGV